MKDLSTKPEHGESDEASVSPSVFISYSRIDQEFATRLADSLESNGCNVYIDREDIAAAAPWREELQLGIEHADSVVFVLSPEFVASKECAWELGYAQEHEKRLLPLLWRQPDLKNVHTALAALNFIDFQSETNYDPALGLLMEALTTDLKWVRAHTRIQVRGLEWDRNTRNRSFMLRGADLVEAEQWLAASPDAQKLRPTSLQIAYIFASRRASNQRRLFTALAAVVGVAVSIVAWWQYKVRLEQQSLALVAEAYRTQYSTPLLSLDKAQRARELLTSETGEDTEEDAKKNMALDAADKAFTAVRRTAVLHAANYEEQGKITGTGAAYLAGRFREGSVFSKLGPNGRHVLLTTERGVDGPDPPGEVYLLDNESLQTVQLVAQEGKGLRLEYAGFTNSGKEVLVSRQFHVEIYDLEGEWKWGEEIGYHGKPIHIVAGYFDDSKLILGDGVGNILIQDIKNDQIKNLAIDGSRDRGAVVRVELSRKGDQALLLFESGEAKMLVIGDDGEPKILSVEHSSLVGGTLVDRNKCCTFLLTGDKDGQVRMWQTTPDAVTPLQDFRHESASIRLATVSDDGARVIAVADNHSIRIWDVESGAVLAAANDDVPGVDWAQLKNKVVRLVPQAQPATAPAGRIMEFPSPELAVSRVVVTDDEVWLLTPDASKPFSMGPAYRVEGETARAYPNEKTSVIDVVRAHGQTWLKSGTYTSPGPVYRIEQEVSRPFPAEKIGVTHLDIGKNDTWIGTSFFGAYRLTNENDGLSAVSSRRPLEVRGIRRFGDQTWLATGQGAYRFDGTRIVRVTDPYLSVDDVHKVGDDTWLITGKGDPGILHSNGPVYRVTTDDAVLVGDPAWQVSKVEHVFDRVWFSMDEGVAWLDGETPIAIRNFEKRVSKLIPAGENLWIQGEGRLPWNERLPGSGPFRINEDKAWKLPDTQWPVISILPRADGTWFQTSKGPIYRLEGERLIAYPEASSMVTAVHEFEGDLWLGTEDGLHRIRNGNATRIEGVSRAIKVLTIFQGEVWAAGENGLYRVDGNGQSQLVDATVALARLDTVADQLWAFDENSRLYTATPSGLKPVFQNANVQVRSLSGFRGRVWALTGSNGNPGPLRPVSAF